MARLLRLGAVGGKRNDASSAVDVEMLLAPVEANKQARGGGVPDVRADLLAEIAVDIKTMLHSSRAAVRAVVEPTSAEQKAILKALYDEAGVTLHTGSAACTQTATGLDGRGSCHAGDVRVGDTDRGLVGTAEAVRGRRGLRRAYDGRM